MRTYEVTMSITRYEKVLVEVEDTKEVNAQAFAKTTLADGEHAAIHFAEDVTPKPKKDKQRINDAFRELRHMGYKATQNSSQYDTYYPEGYVTTMQENTRYAFSYGKLDGLLPIHWDSDTLTKTDTETIVKVFEKHGFDVTFGGEPWDCIEIRGGIA